MVKIGAREGCNSGGTKMAKNLKKNIKNQVFSRWVQKIQKILENPPGECRKEQGYQVWSKSEHGKGVEFRGNENG